MAIKDELLKSKIIPENFVTTVTTMVENGVPIDFIINNFLSAKDSAKKDATLTEEEKTERIGIYDTIIAILKREQEKGMKVKPIGIDEMKAFLARVKSYPENQVLYPDATLELMDDEQIRNTFDLLNNIIGKDEVEKLITTGEDAFIENDGGNWVYVPFVPVNNDTQEKPITMEEKREFVSKLYFTSSNTYMYSKDEISGLSDDTINRIYGSQSKGLSDSEVRRLLADGRAIPIYDTKPKKEPKKGGAPKGNNDSSEPGTDEEYEDVEHSTMDPEPDSGVRVGDNNSKRISKLAKNKGKIKEYFLKGLAVVTLFTLSAPLTILSGIGYVKFKKSILDGTLEVPPFVKNAVEWFDNLGKGKLRRTRKPKDEPEEEVHEESRGRAKA